MNRHSPAAKNLGYQRNIDHIFLWLNILCLPVFSFLSTSQYLFAQKDEIRFERITVDQGLSQNSVICIFQDRKDFMWFGTLDGLNKFDGYEFTHYRKELFEVNTLFYNYITAIYEDKNGRIWIGTDAELLKFDKRSGELKPSGLWHISSICEDDSGKLWVGTAGSGLHKYDREKDEFVNFKHDSTNLNSLSNNVVLNIHKDATGIFWIGTYGGGLDKIDPENEKFTHYKHDPTNPNSLNNNKITALCESNIAQNRKLWIGTEGGGLNCLDLAKNEYTHYIHTPSDPNSLSDNIIQTLLFDEKTATLWIGTKNGGLCRLNIDGLEKGKFTRFKHALNDPNSLSSNNVYTLYQDHSGIIWAGTKGGGLSRFDPLKTKFNHYKHIPYDPNSLGDNKVWSIYEDRAGTIWIGTNSVLSRLNQNDANSAKFMNYQHSPKKLQSLNRYPIRAMCEDRNGTFWFATLNGGLGKFDRTTGEITYYKHDPDNPKSIGSNNIYTIFEDRSGTLWIGLNGSGLSRLEPEKNHSAEFTNYNYNLNSSESTIWWVITINESQYAWDGALWLGTWEKGLIKFDREKNEFIYYTHDPSDPGSLSNNTILAIHEDKNGVLWIGTYGGGLNKLIPPSAVKENLRNSLNQDQGEMNGIENNQVQFVHYTTKDGLPHNIICGILEDDYGNLWLSTNNGLSQFNPQTEEFKNYDINDGLQGNEFYVGSYLKSKNGELFFGGSNGFNNFYPKNIVNAHPPKINLTAFKKFGRKIEFEQPISDVKEIQLSYKDKFFTFEFVALHYKDPLKNQYAYMMAGFDEDWNYIGARREAIYTNLDPGDYTFRVKAANSDGVWNEEGMSIKISIAPPFWQTWWFYLLFSTGIVVSGYNFYRYKIKQILKIERAKIGERERIQRKIAADFHDELGHRATKTSLIAKLLKTQKYLSIQKISNDLDKIADNADCLYKEMKDFIWELDPGKDSIYDLIVQLKNFSDQLFDKTKIAFQLKGLSNELESILLSMSWRQNLLRIFKEGLHNVLKHASGCKNVILSVAIIDRNMELILSDDGQGFDQATCFLGNGIKNMHERANKINGELRIFSHKEKGTKVHFMGELP